MKWLTRVFETLKSYVSRSSAKDSAKDTQPTAPPSETLAETPAGKPVAPEVAEKPADVPVAEEPAKIAGDPAMNKLDSEREAANLPEEPAAKDTPAEEPVAAAEPPAAEAPAAETPAARDSVAEASTAEASDAAAAPAAEKAESGAPATVAAAVDVPAAGEEGPFGPGSAKPLPDGSAPGEEFTVKGKRSSKLFHTAESPYFGRTKADVWFKTPTDAEAAGFAAWNHKKKAAAK